MRNAVIVIRRNLGLLVGTAALIGTFLIGQAYYPIMEGHYLLFHSLAELFSIVVGCGIFIIAWNSRRFIESHYFLVLGVAYLFVSALDLVHTLAYTGMGVFPGYGTNLPAQLWIAARYLESLSLVFAFVFLTRRLKEQLLLLGYAGVCCLALLSIFYWNVFPVCFVEGSGLTSFKKGSEFVIVGILAVALALLWRQRARVDRRVVRWVSLSIVVTMASEVSFTQYASPYGFANMMGHVLKVVSFYLIYKALIEIGLRDPYQVLFRDLRQSQQSLQKARDELETRVRERTADLARTIDELEGEVRHRIRAEDDARAGRRRLLSVLNMLPGWVALVGRDHSVRFANHKYLELFGPPRGGPCYAVQLGRGSPCEGCLLSSIFEANRPQDWEWTDRGGRTHHVWGYPFFDVDGTEVVLELGIDVTELKELEKQVIEASENERRRIGRDLHDTLGQNLTGLAFMIKGLLRKVAERLPEEASTADEIVELVNESVSQVRSLARGLDPVGLDKSGLQAGLQELADSTQSLFGVSCKFHCARPITFEEESVAMHLYHIAQEAVNNVIKHAKARNVDITLEDEDERLRLRIRDDGVGIQTNAQDGTGLGMHTMRYRARVVGGSLTVESGARAGTVVTCFLPKRPAHREGEVS